MSSIEYSNEHEEKEYDFVVPGVVSMVPPGLNKALDVGCSGGALGNFLKTKCGYNEVVGMEYSRAAAENARNFLDDVYAGDAGQIDLPSQYHKYFDLVVYADVLEHLQDPWAVVRKQRCYLNDGGYVLASIPNLKNLFVILRLLAGRFDYTETGLLDKTHLRFFTAETSVEMFTKTGFELINLQRSIRDSKWHAEMNKENKIDQNILNFYEVIYQKYINGHDCSTELKNCFGFFSFSQEGVADLLTAQYHLLLKKNKS